MSVDKTLIDGDVLVDDRPTVTGTRSPTWRRVIFDQPYDRNVQGTRSRTGGKGCLHTTVRDQSVLKDLLAGHS
jgi:hypothetical protein